MPVSPNFLSRSVLKHKAKDDTHVEELVKTKAKNQRQNLNPVLYHLYDQTVLILEASAFSFVKQRWQHVPQWITMEIK